jgi:hypothetical protein
MTGSGLKAIKNAFEKKLHNIKHTKNQNLYNVTKFKQQGPSLSWACLKSVVAIAFKVLFILKCIKIIFFLFFKNYF